MVQSVHLRVDQPVPTMLRCREIETQRQGLARIDSATTRDGPSGPAYASVFYYLQATEPLTIGEKKHEKSTRR